MQERAAFMDWFISYKQKQKATVRCRGLPKGEVCGMLQATQKNNVPKRNLHDGTTDQYLAQTASAHPLSAPPCHLGGASGRCGRAGRRGAARFRRHRLAQQQDDTSRLRGYRRDGDAGGLHHAGQRHGGLARAVGRDDPVHPEQVHLQLRCHHQGRD